MAPGNLAIEQLASLADSESIPHLQRMVPRLAARELRRRLLRYPAVVVVGSRRCGKTMLARSIGGHYFDLEQDPDRLRLDIEWSKVSSGKALVVLDEAQNSPEIFPRIRATIDADRKRMGRFLLLGSVSPSLMLQVGESLAGRLSVLELTPFVYPELTGRQRDRLWLCGGYPDGGVLDPDAFPRWQADYLALLSQRDLPNWGLPAKPQVIGRFLRMLAAVNGQAWNASQVGASLGLDGKTVSSYLDFLCGAFLVRRLQPLHANIGKRLIKSPKAFLRDSGLLHALLSVGNDNQLLAQPWVGASWEGFVIEQCLASLQANGQLFEAFYFRTSDHHELDLVLEHEGERTAVEVKLTTSPSPADVARLNKAADLIGARRRFLVSRAPRTISDGTTTSCDLDHFLSAVCSRA